MDGHLIRFDKKVKYSFIDLETFNLCLTTEYNEPWQTAIINADWCAVIKGFVSTDKPNNFNPATPGLQLEGFSVDPSA